MCLEEKISFEFIDSNTEICKELKSLIIQRLKLECQEYSLLYPSDNFTLPKIIVTADIKNSALNFYTQNNFSEKYISDIMLNRANWNTTSALTLFGQSLADVYMLINAHYYLNGNHHTIIHELTHINDYFSFCKNNDLLTNKYEDFIERSDFPALYFLSEFRAHYRCASQLSLDNLKKDFEWQCKTLSERQQKAIESQQPETFNYIVASFLGTSCSFIERCLTQSQQNAVLLSPKNDYLAVLRKLLYPIKSLSFSDASQYLQQLSRIMDSMIGT